MIRYLIEFILTFVLQSVCLVAFGFLPFMAHALIKEIHVKKEFSKKGISYLHLTNEFGFFKTKLILAHLFQLMVIAIFIFFLIFIEVPSIRDIPSLVTGDFLSTEGVVTEVRGGRSIFSICINNVEVEENNWFFAAGVKPDTKYKIAYLKHTKFIIKAEKIN